MKILNKHIPKTLCSFFLIILVVSSCTKDNGNTISSPDRSKSLHNRSQYGINSYSLSKNNKVIIESSALGMKTDQFELFDNLTIATTDKNSIKQKWTQVWGEQKDVLDEHNELSVKILSDNNLKMIIRFRLYDDGLGFRYEIPKQDGIESFNILDQILLKHLPIMVIVKKCELLVKKIY